MIRYSTFLAFALLSQIAAPAAAQRIHVLIVADVSPAAGWGRYGAYVRADALQMTGFFRTQVPKSLLNLESVVFTSDTEATPAALRAALERISPQPDDAVVFYYTGHGGLDDRGSYFDLAGGKMYRDEVRGALAAAKPRLTVMITDCCNSRSDGLSAGFRDVFRSPESISPLCRSLFIEPTGAVDVNSSAPGESAFFSSEHRGSIFTQSALAWFRENRDRPVRWTDFVDDVSVKVHLLFRERFPDGTSPAKGAPLQTDQNVYAYEYVGMPAERGLRAGLVVRDHLDGGAMILEVRLDSPAAKAFDLTGKTYVALEANSIVGEVNGRPVKNAAEFLAAVDASPRVMRLAIARDGGPKQEYLVRLRY